MTARKVKDRVFSMVVRNRENVVNDSILNSYFDGLHSCGRLDQW